MTRAAGLLAAVAALVAALAWRQLNPRDVPWGASAAEPARSASIGEQLPGGLPATAAEAPDALLARAESVYLRGQLDSAQVLWNGALAEALAGSDSVRQGRILTWIGLAEYRRGNYRLARSIGERALALKHRISDSADLARSHNALGLIAWNEGRLSAAGDHFAGAQSAARAVGDEAGLAKAANNAALVHTELGDFAEARRGFELTREAGVRLGDGRIEGGALANLGMLDIQLGDPGTAIGHLTRARTLYRAVGFEIGEQNALGQLGTAYDAIGEAGLAFAALDSALQLSRRQGLRQEEASNLELIAGLHRQAGNLRRALRIYAEANRLNAELGLEVERGATLRSAAEVQLALGRADRALPDAHAALLIHRATGAKLQELRDRLLLADIASRAADDVTAAEQLGSAAVMARALGARTTRVEVALAQAAIADRADDPGRVLSVLRAAAHDLARGGYGTEWIAARLSARAFARLGQLDSAVARGRRAVDAVERVRGSLGSGYLRTGYLADRSVAYDELVDVLLRLDRPADALEIADAARNGALLEHLAATGVSGAAGSTVHSLGAGGALLRQIDSLISRLDATEERGDGRDGVVSLTAELVEARSAYEGLLVTVAERDAAGAGLLGGRRTAADEVRRALEPGEALLEYYVAPAGVTAFIVTLDGIRSLTTAVSRDDLARRARLARELLGQRNLGPEAGDLLTALHGILVSPLERAGLLRGTRRLIIVPHSILAYLPFAALRSSASGRYLVEDYAMVTLPSAAALSALRRSARPSGGRGQAFVMAPFPGALPASAREARAVRRTLGGTETLVGPAATERSLRRALGGTGLVHVATHGVMNRRNPMFSRVELARGTGDPRDDGRLEVHEVLGLRIAAPLVFLSGCETGVGAAWSTEFAQGEDYATLAQAFLYAGAGTVVATLWRVADDGAAAFAERFYSRLPSMAFPEALAAAQRETLRNARYGSPYHWAAYQISGGLGAGSPPIVNSQ